MKCLEDELIQMYIDGEIASSELESLELHIKSCNSCRSRLEEQWEVARFVRYSINTLTGEPPSIPSRRLPVRKSSGKRKILTRILYPLAAASAILLLLFKPFSGSEGRDGKDIYMVSGVAGEIDANLPLSEQELTFIIVDQQGKGQESMPAPVR